MTRRKGAHGATVALLTGIAMLAAGCSTSPSGADGSASASEAASPAPGVTADAISLGLLTDLSAVFANQGKLFSNAYTTYWDTVNAEGGVCDRQVQVLVRDHGYQPQKAVTEYQQMKSDVLAMQHVLGSPVVAALLPELEKDKMMAIPAAYSSSLLASKEIVMVDATYDYQMIAGLGWLIEQGKVASGDKVGHIYFEGDYGANALLGSKHVAEKQGLEIVEVQITPQTTDLTAQVASLKKEGVKAIMLSVGPPQTASAAAADAASGLNVPLLGNDPTYIPQLLDTPAGDALKANFHAVFSVETPDFDGLKKFTDAYKAKFPDEVVDMNVAWSFATGEVMRNLLSTACANGDLTRESLYEAFRATSALDTGGVMPPLDFSVEGASPTTQVRVYVPDATASNGLKAVTPLISGKDADSYTPPAQSS